MKSFQVSTSYGLMFVTLFGLLIFSCAPSEKKAAPEENVSDYLDLERLDERNAAMSANMPPQAMTEEQLGKFAFKEAKELENGIYLMERDAYLSTLDYSDLDIDVEIFKEYNSRNFITGVSDRYDLIETLGNIYYALDDGFFQKISTKALVNGKPSLEVQKVDKVYFNNVLHDKKSMNAGIAFLGLKASSEMKAEVLIKDELSVILPSEYRNVELLKRTIEQLESNGLDLTKYYYSYGATLSSITYKIYKSSAWRPAIDASWLTLGGDKHISVNNFAYDADVHVDLIPLTQAVIVIP